ncbi:hypothetical protein MVES1_002881 [Malassezia vespertilionis]|uniref:uncharacterized protein n=1 Tax=Malassezia vespertilionis TaxID=2020962 RepID=UPI0024B11591|nr:uncharacterized protein MVES1_002881 [Malassezia vespertilionis]WFD07515.1 hypothetical protein MVES1_002881 [Malassezia vespertilionis]
MPDEERLRAAATKFQEIQTHFKEARVNVEKRIEFIQNEIKRVEDKIQSLGTQRDTIRNDILAIQQGS